MEKELVYELIMKEDAEHTGVDAISFVENPAHEEHFMKFSEDVQEYTFKELDEEKRIVVGAAMIPNQKIVRKDAKGNKFFVFFSEKTVRDSMEKYFRLSKQTGATVEHSEKVSGVTVVESWIVEDPNMDKSIALGFSALPKGTWMATYKIDNDELWNDIKEGKMHGFSIEGFFGGKRSNFSTEDVVDTGALLMEDIKSLLESGASDEYIEKELKKKLNE